jgi:hypothetical protein
MDDIVKQAMAKWPHVPDCYGWLGLDTRGNWYMRDDAAQACGAFASGLSGAKGSQLRHDKLVAFIGRNYACNDQGEWFFQNGPQRVYVELEATPWVWRVQSDFSLETHTGQATHATACVTDEYGWLYLHTPLGLGLVHTQDVAQASEAVESGRWVVTEVQRNTLPAHHGYITSPQRHLLSKT